jgi:hypothetical protein
MPLASLLLLPCLLQFACLAPVTLLRACPADLAASACPLCLPAPPSPLPPPQVDRWLQPYLQLALSRLAKAENRSLKDELLVFVANALYYNAAATMQLLQQFNAVQQLFALWFGCIFERK